MLEIKHLRTVHALSQQGSMRKAADYLYISLSALSHQIKELESKIGHTIFERGSSPVAFTHKGQHILNLANQVLPMWEETQHKLLSPAQNHYQIGLECHACFQWLIPAIEQLNQSYPNVSFDFIDEIFEQDKTIDLLFSDTPQKSNKCIEHYIGQFELVTVLPKKHPLTEKPYISAEDFQDTTLLTYPIAPEKMDIFKLLLTPNDIKPARIKSVKNSHTLLQMVCANTGIAVLPHWLISAYAAQHLVTVKPISAQGIYRKMYARYPRDIAQQAMFAQLILLSKEEFNQLALTSNPS